MSHATTTTLESKILGLDVVVHDTRSVHFNESLEDLNNPVEIVIHVNILKEGWDVKNLYTIVPLRAANSRTLVEQSIGRGLRRRDLVQSRYRGQ